ncbi:MAG TPA: DUF1330 domain-containing protein [Caulifigura sp.]|jgi:uncharacterized protein (DUF1330 family)|nr:DUF1330 domain-containing protein [Caulifigura sp.]
MSVYAIFIKERTVDPHELEIYAGKAGPSLDGHPAEVLAAYGGHVTLEGPDHEGVVIVEFPTMEAAKEWYESPAYREAREYRFRGAQYRAMIVQGL